MGFPLVGSLAEDLKVSVRLGPSVSSERERPELSPSSALEQVGVASPTVGQRGCSVLELAGC